MNLTEWNLFNKEKKLETIYKLIKNLSIPFKIKQLETFEQNHIKLETIILEYQEKEFVFVPGSENVTLGWDTEICDLGENIKKVLQDSWTASKKEALEEIEYIKQQYEPKIKKAVQSGYIKLSEEIKSEMENNLNHYNWEINIAQNGFQYFNDILKKEMSPLRTATIPPVIVQRDIQKNIDTDKFTYNKVSFSIPTEDEWEYLCNGGSRTFFRWGDTLEKELYQMYSIGTSDASDFFYQPNMFGLHIAYNPYVSEIVISKKGYMVKTGDGGGALCGGAPPMYLIPLFSAFYRGNTFEKDCLNSWNYYRKILRLEEKNFL